jgi:4-hydroxybenzoate polyprenyltransferase
MDFKKFSKLIMLEQTLFALPFAYLGVLFAGGGRITDWIWVTLAVFAGRTAGMSFNRYLDAEIDAKNPRTRNRSIPAGELSATQVLVLGVFSSVMLIFTSYMLNNLCFYLSFAAIFLLYTYSYLKRFSSASHIYLGFVEAAAPIGGYLAVTGSFIMSGKLDFVPFVLGLAIMLWIAGIDIVYSIQDMEFDSAEGLLSLPVRYGKGRALIYSMVFYLASIGVLMLAGIMTGRGISYWVAVACAALVMMKQQALSRDESLADRIEEIFRLNTFISPVLFAGTFIDVFIKPY